MYSHHEVRPALARGACVEDSGDIRVVHHRQSLALVCKTSEHLIGVHPESYYFEGGRAANGFALLGQVHGAHASFPDWPDDRIKAEVVITGCRPRTIDGLSSKIVRANRTIESALDQTLRAQSRGIIGTQFCFALRAVWHLDQRRSAHSIPLCKLL
jgi:hypothetical protein